MHSSMVKASEKIERTPVGMVSMYSRNPRNGREYVTRPTTSDTGWSGVSGWPTASPWVSM